MKRGFHAWRPLRSGHNRWSKIRHTKGAKDAVRGDQFGKLSKEISIAAKCKHCCRWLTVAGGRDLQYNDRLYDLVALAKKG